MNSFDDLAALDLRSLSEALAAHVPGVSELGPNEWLGVVELLTARLADECRGLSGASWGTCSEALGYALNSAVASGVIDHRESVIRLLNLSLAVLRQVPSNAEIDILNPDLLIDLLFRELPMSVEEARDLSADWRTREIAQIRRLRAVKNLLSPALALVRMAFGEDFDERLKAWEEVFPSLP
ncbi:hypothetical protein [Streptomyces exfoliatus]|uniref:hypothetical protein n=1 Tax=Streptomyces exfoliatus TaxID=1905 RepID=UPI0012FE8BDB|nr:hypothetical protein [Streptomyces exfoliatus]